MTYETFNNNQTMKTLIWANLGTWKQA